LTEGTHEALDWLQRELDHIISSYQTPQERRVGYGNLRHEYSTWRKKTDGDTTNIAIIYETPGGSTTQLNITYEHADGTFHYLDTDLEKSVITTDPREALHVIETHVKTIPQKRQAQVDSQVDAWMGAGKSKREVFGELNKLLQTAFLGGRITTAELKAAIQYAIKLKAEHDRQQEA